MRLIESATGTGDLDAALWIELWSHALRDEEMAATREELDRRWRQAIATIVRRGRRRASSADTDADDLALMLASVLDGMAVQIALGDRQCAPAAGSASCP